MLHRIKVQGRMLRVGACPTTRFIRGVAPHEMARGRRTSSSREPDDPPSKGAPCHSFFFPWRPICFWQGFALVKIPVTFKDLVHSQPLSVYSGGSCIHF